MGDKLTPPKRADKPSVITIVCEPVSPVNTWVMRAPMASPVKFGMDDSSGLSRAAACSSYVSA